MTIDRELLDALYWTHFGAFTCEALKVLNPGQRLIPNWHIDAICYRVQQMVTGEAPKRLILNLPPRTLKSSIASVALPAWLLGRNPSTRIICASYSDELRNILVVGSDGTFAEDSQPLARMNVSCIAKTDGNSARGSAGGGGPPAGAHPPLRHGIRPAGLPSLCR